MQTHLRKQRILFVCTYRGARSQIAELFARQLAGDKIDAHSSCFESGKIGPLVVNVMQEVGIDLPSNSPPRIHDRFKAKENFDCVITLCHEATTEQCAVFRRTVDTLYGANTKRLSWSIPDFKALAGSDDEKKNAVREVRDLIKLEVERFLSSILTENFG